MNHTTQYPPELQATLSALQQRYDMFKKRLLDERQHSIDNCEWLEQHEANLTKVLKWSSEDLAIAIDRAIKDFFHSRGETE